jgi:hypothetical protein
VGPDRPRPDPVKPDRPPPWSRDGARLEMRFLEVNRNLIKCRTNPTGRTLYDRRGCCFAFCYFAFCYLKQRDQRQEVEVAVPC